jgi:hypothetical protein
MSTMTSSPIGSTTCKKTSFVHGAVSAVTPRTAIMTDSIEARTAYLIAELTSLHGFLPYEMRSSFTWLGARLGRSFFAPAYVPPSPPPRTQCTGLTRAGTQCTNRASIGCEKCRVHSRVPVAKPKCTQCKCPAFKGLDVCVRHGRKDGRIEPPPVECAICYDAMTVASERKKTPCGHYFHKACLATWTTTSHVRRPPCPMCRAPLTRPRPAAH